MIGENQCGRITRNTEKNLHGLNKDSVPYKGMRGDRTFTCQSCFSFKGGLKSDVNFSTAYRLIIEQINGGSERFVWSVGLFPIVQTSIDGRGYSSTNKAAWKSFDVEA